MFCSGRRAPHGTSAGAVALALALAVAPGATQAHSPISGADGFLTGLLHPLSTPDQVLALLALGVLLGLRFSARAVLPWLGFVAGVPVGMGMGQVGPLPPGIDTALLLMAAGTASLAALWPTGTTALALAMAGAIGLAIGLASTPGPGPLQATLVMLAGSMLGANLCLLYATGGIGWLRETITHPALAIGLRVLAAWIAAISVLMAALTMTGR